jgi:hypothetical protein
MLKLFALQAILPFVMFFIIFQWVGQGADVKPFTIFAGIQTGLPGILFFTPE